MKTYKGMLTTENMPENGIFVFGSNTQGRHGGGAAKYAVDHFGAVYGQSTGLQGRSYAIVTKDLTKSTHPSIDPYNIERQIRILYIWARSQPDTDFYITYSAGGQNRNAYSDQDMAYMFSCSPIPDNIVFEEGFSKLLV